jgi:sigma-E factor negative regulatory protein RseA
MKQPIGESLSALMDQEADDLDLQRVLNGLCDDDELVQRWRRYHLVSDAMHHDLDSFAQVDLTSRIHDALPQEGAHLLRRRRLAGLVRPVASVAVAASVTALILSGAQLYDIVAGDVVPPPVVVASNGDVSGALAVSRSVGFSSPMLQASAVGGSLVADSSLLLNEQGLAAQIPDYNEADALARQKLSFHLQSHLENASLNSSSGMMPFARAASYRSER